MAELRVSGREMDCLRPRPLSVAISLFNIFHDGFAYDLIDRGDAVENQF